MRSRSAVFLAVLSLGMATAAAQTPDRWQADDTEAKAALPGPRDNGRVSGAALACEAQRWTLTLAVSGADALAGTEATLRVDGNAFPARLAVRPGALAVSVPRAALAPLKAGLRLDVEFSGTLQETVGDVSFSLRGSRIAITALEERCSLRDMSPYQPVTFTPYSSYVALARELRQDDIEAFAVSTASQPALDVAMVEFGGGRRVLFARLCGSSWYYGASGCNITGFAPMQGEAEGDADTALPWRPVYDTENVLLHTDPNGAAQGWRDIVTLPARGAGPGRVWRWNGSGYSHRGELPEEPDDEPLPLRAGQD